jgi:hypothetical protein
MWAQIGTWNHAFPNDGEPGPNYEWRQIAVRWWQQWLNGQQTGVLDAPRFTVFMRGSVPPDIDLKQTPGAWWSEEWPVRRTVVARFIPQKDKTLGSSPGEAAVHTLAYKADAGVAVGFWWAETSGDMRSADEYSLVYDSSPLEENKCLLGFPKVRLTVSTDAPLAHWMARLEDVRPDGTVSLITGGLINGAQRESRTDPKAIVPGESFTLDFPMRFTTWTFEKGHRIRLAVTNAQFPMVWPTPFRMTTTLKVGDGSSELLLPFVSPTDRPAPVLPPPEPTEERLDARVLEDVEQTPFRAVQDPQKGTTTVTSEESSSWVVADRQYRTRKRLSQTANPADPASADALGEGMYEIRMGDRTVTARVTVRIDSDARKLHVFLRREIHENGKLVRDREWREDIPRDFQ